MSRDAPIRYNGGAPKERASVFPFSPLACIPVFPYWLFFPQLMDFFFTISCHLGKMCFKLPIKYKIYHHRKIVRH